MAKTYQKFIGLGYIGGPPEIKPTPDGRRHATFYMSTSRMWRDKNGRPRRDTQRHRVVAWEHESGGPNLVHAIELMAVEGRFALVEGRVEYRHYSDDRDERHVLTEIVASDITFVERIGAGGEPDEE